MADEWWDEPDPNWIFWSWVLGLACLVVVFIELNAGWLGYAASIWTFLALHGLETFVLVQRKKYGWTRWCWERRVIVGLPFFPVMWAIALAIGKLTDVMWP